MRYIIPAIDDLGVIDSTHLFEVTYKVDEKQVMSWEVDLRNKKVKKRE